MTLGYKSGLSATEHNKRPRSESFASQTNSIASSNSSIRSGGSTRQSLRNKILHPRLRNSCTEQCQCYRCQANSDYRFPPPETIRSPSELLAGDSDMSKSKAEVEVEVDLDSRGRPRSRSDMDAERREVRYQQERRNRSTSRPRFVVPGSRQDTKRDPQPYRGGKTSLLWSAISNNR